MKKSRYTDTQIVNILKQNQAGESVANLCREYGMSQQHFTNGDLNMVMQMLMLLNDLKS